MEHGRSMDSWLKRTQQSNEEMVKQRDLKGLFIQSLGGALSTSNSNCYIRMKLLPSTQASISSHRLVGLQVLLSLLGENPGGLLGCCWGWAHSEGRAVIGKRFFLATRNEKKNCSACFLMACLTFLWLCFSLKGLFFKIPSLSISYESFW